MDDQGRKSDNHFHRILVATDFSPTATNAAMLGARLAGPGAALRLATVRPPAEANLALVNPSRGELRRLQKQRKNRTKKATKDLEHLRKHIDRKDAEIVVLEGSVGPAVVEEAKRWNADLIVAAASSSDERREDFGTKARSIMRNAKCDVLFARAGGNWEVEDRAARVAVATDFQASSEEAARVALGLSQRLGTQLVAVHVMDRHLWIEMLAEHGTGGVGEPGLTWSTMQERLGRKLHEFNQRVMDGKAQEVIVAGDPHTEIGQIAARNEVDLLVLGSQGDRIAGSVNLGSVAAEVGATASMSVLLVR